MSDAVQQIKDRLSIVDVVSQYVKLERAGSTMRARCPFHSERTPSFFVSAERGTYHCFGCSAGGDIFSFVEQIEGLDFKGALKILAEKAGVPIVYEKKSERDSHERLFELLETVTIFYVSNLTDSAREYLHKRGINDDTIKSFRVGLSEESWSGVSDYLRGKGFSEKEILDAGLAKRGERGLYDRFRSRIIFPIADSAGRVVGFSGRIFSASAKGGPASGGKGNHGSASGGPVSPTEKREDGFEPPKYLNSPETELFHKSKILYAYDRAKQAIRKNNCAVLVEGQLDLLASHQAGWANTVAVSGTAFTPEHAVLISRMTENLVIALDADEAGIKAAGRAARSALRGGLNVKVARLPEGKDPADLILESGKEAWSKAIRESKDIIMFLLEVLSMHIQGAGKGSLERDRFRKAVETIVLPYLADVQSPIARDLYVRGISERLGVSERAVLDALANVPRDAAVSDPQSGNVQILQAKIGNFARPSSVAGYERVRHAFSILLWQESCEKPQLDVASYIREFGNAIGNDAYKILRGLPENEQEALRFAAEKLYGNSQGLKREAKTLLDILLRDRLTGELAAASSSLKTAESEGNDGVAEEMMRLCKLLTTQIAQLPG